MKIFIACLLLIVSPFYNVKSQSKGNIKKRVVLKLLPGPDNPRNSEGAFITLKNGNILYIYSHFTGASGDDYGHAYLASRFSADQGKTWSNKDKIVLEQEAKVNVMSVSLLRLKNGNIGLFYLRKNSKEDCIPMMSISRNEAETWGTPTPCITDKKGYFVLNNDRVIQLSSGRLLMPVALHRIAGQKDFSRRGDIFCYYSDNNGKDWYAGRQIPNPFNVVTQEPGVVNLKNGNILLFVRTKKGVQYASFSTNDGTSWSVIEPTKIISPLSPASMKRIPSTGDLLLVWNNNGKNQKRIPLNVAVSKNEGKDWEHIKTIENDTNGIYCYTAIHFIGKYVILAYSNWDTMSTALIRIKISDLYH